MNAKMLTALAAILGLSLVGCGGSAEPGAEEAAEATAGAEETMEDMGDAAEEAVTGEAPAEEGAAEEGAAEEAPAEEAPAE